MLRDDWVALHVFYAANANPMLTEAVAPLLADLRAEGQIDRWFFIRYWMEGPHIRLRLLPAAGVDRDALTHRAVARLEQFLSRRPALYEEDRNDSDELYRNMFIAEYSAAEWDERYGPDGRMPFRANNSIAEMEYEREYSRYGGPDAIELAEHHFEFSSEEVIRTLATTSVHLRTILLGQAVQQTLALSFAMLGTADAVRSFLLDYRIMWETSYQEPSEGQHEGFDRSFLAMRDRLVGRVEHVRDVVRGEALAEGSVARWLCHGAELREAVADLHRANVLRFREGASPDLDASVRVLLSSFVHMSNNRLGASILDEIYISYVLVKAIDDLSATLSVSA